MSHLACAEDAGHPLNGEQLDALPRRSCAALPGAPASLANSSGIFLGPDYHFDLLRPGAALYGINPAAGPAQSDAAQWCVCTRKILQVRRIDAVQTVGYGATHGGRPARRVATVALGYADGFLRIAHQPRRSAIIAGQRVPSSAASPWICRRST